MGSAYGDEPAAEIKFVHYQQIMAETEGFEPSVGVIPLRRFSKPLVSATHPRLRTGSADGGYSQPF